MAGNRTAGNHMAGNNTARNIIEPVRIELHLSHDERFLGAVGSAGAFVAERAGLESYAQAAVAHAAEEACRAAFPSIKSTNEKLDVTVEQFSDRIEVTLAYRETTQPMRSPATAPANDGGPLESSEPLSKMDKVRHTSASGISKTTLIKNLR